MIHDILIIDDEADIRTQISGILTDEGYQTRAAEDGVAALREVRARRPSLVILDIWFKGKDLDGLGVLNVLQRESPYLPVVMISGHGNIETAVTAIKRGAYDYIEKPFKSDRLLLIVERAIEAARLRRENAELRLKAGDEAELIGRTVALLQDPGLRARRAAAARTLVEQHCAPGRVLDILDTVYQSVSQG